MTWGCWGKHQPLSSLDPGCEERQVEVRLENTVGLLGSEGRCVSLKLKQGGHKGSQARMWVLYSLGLSKSQ